MSDAWARRLGDSVPDWPAFPDSADALARLARRYKLIILSNVHRAGFAGSNRHLRGDFAAIITAEDVGGYKPGPNHFRALDAALPGLGVERAQLLHVAQSLFHDHVPAKRRGPPVGVDQPPPRSPRLGRDAGARRRVELRPGAPLDGRVRGRGRRCVRRARLSAGAHSTPSISSRSAATCALSALRPRAVSAIQVVRRPSWTPLCRLT